MKKNFDIGRLNLQEDISEDRSGGDDDDEPLNFFEMMQNPLITIKVPEESIAKFKEEKTETPPTRAERKNKMKQKKKREKKRKRKERVKRIKKLRRKTQSSEKEEKSTEETILAIREFLDDYRIVIQSYYSHLLKNNGSNPFESPEMKKGLKPKLKNISSRLKIVSDFPIAVNSDEIVNVSQKLNNNYINETDYYDYEYTDNCTDCLSSNNLTEIYKRLSENSKKLLENSDVNTNSIVGEYLQEFDFTNQNEEDDLNKIFDNNFFANFEEKNMNMIESFVNYLKANGIDPDNK